MIKIGTRVRRKNPFFGKTSDIGEIFEVVYVSDERIEAAKKTEDRSSVYSFSPDDFSKYFEIADDRIIVGDYTESELDDLWRVAGSYEDLKTLLKLGTKWHEEKTEKQSQQRRTWTDWKRWGDGFYDYSVSRSAGQSAKVKVRTPEGFIGIASCSPGDDFDLAYGVELASIRAEIKGSKADIDQALKDYLFEHKILGDLKNRLAAVLNRAYGKAEK